MNRETNQAIIVEDDTGTFAGPSTETTDSAGTSLPTPEGSSKASKHTSLFASQ